MLRRPSIHRQILVAMLIIGLLPVVVITAQSLHCAHEGVMDLQRRQLRALLGEYQARLGFWMIDREHTLRTAAANAAIRDALGDAPDHPHQSLHTIREFDPYLASLTLYDRDWQALDEVGEVAPAARPPLDPELRQRLAEGASVAWAVRLGTDDAGMLLGWPVPGPSGSVDGYLVADTDFPRVTAAWTGSRVYLLDNASHRYLSAPADAAALIGTTAVLPAVGTGHDHAHHLLADLAVYNDHRGEKVLGSSRTMPGMPWLLVAEVDYDDAFALLDFLLRRASYASAFMLVVIAVIAVPTARRLSRPLRELTRVCRRIADGSTDQRLAALPSREANEVASSFNTMLDRLGEMQHQLVQAGTLAAIGELSASIVHEMRNPLNTVQMNLEALHRRVADTPQDEELFALAQRQAGRLQRMLDDLLNFGKPLALNLAPHDLRPLVDDIVRLWAERASARQVRFALQAPAEPVTARLDPEQFLRAMGNLVDNAIQASPVNGTVTIAIATDEAGIRLAVTDEGPGVPDGLRDKIFRPFFTTREQGTGLGLAIVRKLVELHGGSLTLDSGTAAGACFIIRLPRFQEEPA